MYITEMRYALWKGEQINKKSIDMHAILLLSIHFIYSYLDYIWNRLCLLVCHKLITWVIV